MLHPALPTPAVKMRTCSPDVSRFSPAAPEVRPSSEAGDPQSPALDVTIVLPVFNERDCLEATLCEVMTAMRRLPQRFETIAVDDASTDDSLARLRTLQSRHPELRVLRLLTHGGQSAAFSAGIRAARGAITVLMDADGQNDPADIPRLLDRLSEADAVCGYRLSRRDTWSKQVGSRIANAVRRRVLGDGCRDTGCSLKAIRTTCLRELPLHLAGMHRFIPALLQMSGARVIEIPVTHRPRAAGRSKYTNLGRLLVTAHDLLGVAWLRSRHRRVVAEEFHVQPSPPSGRAPGARHDSQPATERVYDLA